MRKNHVLALISVLLTQVAVGQLKKQFAVETSESCSAVHLALKANSGNCYIKPSQNLDLLNVFSNQSENEFSHNFRKWVEGSTCNIYLALEEEAQNEGITQTISTHMFSPSEASSSNKFWKMYLTDSKPYSLEMNYGIGKANVDLSGLAIQKLKINSGSADVYVHYASGLENQIEMDTFFVKVDLGSVNVKNLSLTKTKCLLADVGFGNMLLDFSTKPTISNTIKGSVGAGNLVIVLPAETTPIMVKIHDSWLCSVKLPKSLVKTAENTFTTPNYTKEAKEALTFYLDVSMGSIVFKESATR